VNLCRQNEELEQASLAIQEEKERLEKEAQSLAQQLQAVLNDKFVPQRDFDADTPIDKTLKMMQTIIGVRTFVCVKSIEFCVLLMLLCHLFSSCCCNM